MGQTFFQQCPATFVKAIIELIDKDIAVINQAHDLFISPILSTLLGKNRLDFIR